MILVQQTASGNIEYENIKLNYVKAAMAAIDEANRVAYIVA
jgi:hypothetical protein